MTIYDLPLSVHDTADELGRVTGERAGNAIREAIAARGRARVMLAAAPSQEPTLHSLASQEFDRTKVEFFHMDDYLGLPVDAPQGFANWLEAHFFDYLGAGSAFHRMQLSGEPEQAAAEYAQVLGEAPFDVTLCGLGVNAHLAFNDPPARFDDPHRVRVVQLEGRSRRQQVDEGHFSDLEAVPVRALTVTIPRLMNAGLVLCSVLGEAKRWAVTQTVARDLDPEVPGTALKAHPHAELHVDREAAPHE